MESGFKPSVVPKSTLTAMVGKYNLGAVIGKGSFGEVYLATVDGEDLLYAVKKEDESIKHPQLIGESKILKLFDKYVGFPKIHWVGQQKKANYMAIQLLGPSLQDLFYMCGRRFTLKTTIMLADQIISRLEQLHSLNYIHRDIKPQNFLMGLDDKSHIVHLIDFGLSRRYRDPKSHQHIPYKENKMLTGTVRYSSLNTHFGFEQSRRDDLESVGFVFIYFMLGYLPWQGVKGNTKAEKYQKIQQSKLSVPIELLCKGLPIQFCTYMNYCSTLKFQEKPDYKYLRKLFRDLFERVGLCWDHEYDWCNFKAKKQVDTINLTVSIEAKGDEIADINMRQSNKKIDLINESDINLNLESRNEDLLNNGIQNVPEDSLQNSNLSLIDQSQAQSQLLSKGLIVRNMIEW